MASFNVALTGNIPAVKHLTNFMRNASAARDPKMGEHTAEAIDTLVNNMTQLKGTVNIPVGGVITVIMQELLLAAASTTILPAQPPKVGSQLVVVLTQDASGGRQIVWGTGFHNPPINIDTTASTQSIFTFIGRVNPSNGVVEWYMQTLPITGAAL